MTKIEGPGSTPPVPGGGLSPIPAALGAVDKLGEMFEHSDYPSVVRERGQDWLLPHNPQQALKLRQQGFCDVWPDMVGYGFISTFRRYFGARLPDMLTAMLDNASKHSLRRISVLPQPEGEKVLLQGCGDNDTINIIEADLRPGYMGPELYKLRCHKNLVMIPSDRCPRILNQQHQACLTFDEECLDFAFIDACRQVAQQTGVDAGADLSLWKALSVRKQPATLYVFPHHQKPLEPIQLAIMGPYSSRKNAGSHKHYTSAWLAVLMPIPGSGYVLDSLQPTVFALYEFADGDKALNMPRHQDDTFNRVYDQGVAPALYWCGQIRTASKQEPLEGYIMEVYSKAPTKMMQAVQQLPDNQKVQLVKHLVDQLAVLHRQSCHGNLTVENMIVNTGRDSQGLSCVKGVWLVDFSAMATQSSVKGIINTLTKAARGIDGMLVIQQEPTRYREVLEALIAELADPDMVDPFLEQLDQVCSQSPLVLADVVNQLVQLVGYIYNNPSALQLRHDLSQLAGERVSLAEVAVTTIASLTRWVLNDSLKEVRRSLSGWSYRLAPEQLLAKQLCEQLSEDLSAAHLQPEILLTVLHLVELLSSDATQADIWALGICIMQMLGMRISDEVLQQGYAGIAMSRSPGDFEAHLATISKHYMAQLGAFSGLHGDSPLTRLAELANVCLEVDPQLRPSAAEISEELQRYLMQAS